MSNDRLPHLEGTTLSGRTVQFPQDLPPSGLALVIGFTHAARLDVGAWKAALKSRAIPFLSLPTSAMELAAAEMVPVAMAMRAHVPQEAWDQVVQVHLGGEVLRHMFDWEADVFAKLLRVTGEGEVLARHDEGPFSGEALAAFLG